jgi:SAM-dependent methyltransferase
MTTERDSPRSLSEGRFCDYDNIQSRRAVAPFYGVIANCRRRYLAAVCAGAGPGVRVLELGCGQSRTAVSLARLGADVHAIDLSGSALKTASAAAAAEGVTIRHRMMDGERLAYPDGVFDLVCGSGVLHHLELHHALGETIRVLKPDGRAVFMEPLGHNLLINGFRWATPHMRTQDEHPLLTADFEMMRHSFMAVDIEFFALFALLGLPVAQTRIAPRLLSALWQLDELAFRRWPTLQRAAWYSLLILSGPEKPDRAAP